MMESERWSMIKQKGGEFRPIKCCGHCILLFINQSNAIDISLSTTHLSEWFTFLFSFEWHLDDRDSANLWISKQPRANEIYTTIEWMIEAENANRVGQITK